MYIYTHRNVYIRIYIYVFIYVYTYEYADIHIAIDIDVDIAIDIEIDIDTGIENIDIARHVNDPIHICTCVYFRVHMKTCRDNWETLGNGEALQDISGA